MSTAIAPEYELSPEQQQQIVGEFTVEDSVFPDLVDELNSTGSVVKEFDDSMEHHNVRLHMIAYAEATGAEVFKHTRIGKRMMAFVRTT